MAYLQRGRRNATRDIQWRWHMVERLAHARGVRPARSFDSEAAGRFMLDTSAKRDAGPDGTHVTGRRAEFFVFAVIAAFIWPVVAVGVVGGYGFLVWMTQMVLGPP